MIQIRKKGQIEIMGLMIVVVILSLLLLFVIKVVFTAKQVDYTQDYETNKLVESFVNTLFQTTAACTGDVTIQELLLDCARYPHTGGSITCNDDDEYAPDYRQSCAFANDKIAYILENSVDQWGFADTGYEFIAIAPPNEEIVYYSRGDLEGSLSGEVEPFTLRMYPSTEDLYVYLCIGGCGFR
jgi:hypothetical protein